MKLAVAVKHLVKQHNAEPSLIKAAMCNIQFQQNNKEEMKAGTSACLQ